MTEADDTAATDGARPTAAPDGTRPPSRCSRPPTGCPALSVSADEIAEAAERLAAGTGPFAVDAERASGFRYSNRAYLIQIRRAGAGTVLIDPVNHGGDPLDVLAPVADVLADRRVDPARRRSGSALPGRGRHAAARALRHRIGRPAGRFRPGQPGRDGASDCSACGLAKGHGAADWSKRPLPAAWLNYAALDVEVLDRTARRRSRGAGRAGQNRLGGRGIRVPARVGGARRPAGTAGGAPPASTRCATRGRWPRCANCGRRATRSPAAATSPRGGSCPTRRSSTPHRRPEDRRRAHRPCRSSAGTSSAAARRSGWTRWTPRPQQPRPAGRRRAAERSAAAGAVGQAQARGGRTAGGRPRGAGGAVRAGRRADREPGLPRTGPPAVLGLAGHADAAGAVDAPARRRRGRGSASGGAGASRR